MSLYSTRFFFFLMIRRPPRSTLSSSSAASDVYKRQLLTCVCVLSMPNVRPAAFAFASLMFLFGLLSKGAGDKFDEIFTEGFPPDWSSLCAMCALFLLVVGVADIAVGTY
eukprot:TRINITY_DN6463_c0_g1_i5.p1 TRINITY_DN6463_c0_g1~~TRINITY_DN6463_c0_g1_i5.p1  ORF type:complete len:110 (-),score=26.63 TRINITY_DN6463_c0_g1_i5:230-559(-)